MRRYLAGKVAARNARRHGDVVVGYQKSGRTWLRLMLHDLGIVIPFTHADADWQRRTPLAAVGEAEPFRHRRVVFLVRDPRDVVVSWHLEASLVHGLHGGDLKSFLREPDLGIAHVCRFDRRWLEAGAGFGRFLVVAYEDLRADAAAELARIVAFLKVPFITRGMIARAVADNAIERMRAREASGELAQLFPGRFRTGDVPAAARKVRTGAVGGFRAVMDEEDLAFCAAVMRAEGFDPGAAGLVRLAAGQAPKRSAR